MAECGMRPNGYETAITSTDRTDRTAALLYILMRNGDVSPGLLEEEVWKLTDGLEGKKLEIAFSNDYLALYAIELSERLAGSSYYQLREDFSK